MITIVSLAQTPGMIIKPAGGTGALVLDPDGDGYVSQKTNGIQLGFTIPPDNDVIQSEIPYVALVRPDVQGDLQKGPAGGFTEIVGTDAAGNNAILTYSDDNYLYYRFRLSGYASNSKSYSILIDTDQKFGFTGPNKDDNAVVGNPGFEVEIVLETNFNVKAFNVDGSAARPSSAVESALYETNCQKSIAVSKAGGDMDYFYDFYLPYPTTLFTKDTPLRYVALTSINPMPAIGNNGISDVGGVGEFGDLDQAFMDLIDAQTPTIPGGEVLERTSCPLINSVSLGDLSISGTTEGVNTIINVSVYQNDGTTLLCSNSITTSSSSWNIHIGNLCPLQLGYKIRATAIAPGKGVSYDNCDIETVTSVPCNIQAPSSIGFSNSDKNIDITFSTAVTGIVTVYNSNGTTWKAQAILNTTTISMSGGLPQTGNGKIPNGSYYATLTIGSCESGRVYGCLNSTLGSNKPTLNSPITLESSTITGTGGIAGANIIIYANGNQIATTISGDGIWTANVSNLLLCQSITAKQVEAGKCISLASDALIVTRPAAKPTLLTTGCFSSPGSIYGISTEVGATVTLYKTFPLTAILGTAIVGIDRTWTVNNLTLNNGDVVAAAVTSGPCLTASVNSAPVTISTQTTISDYTISFNQVVEKQTSVSGTISGGTYPITLKLFVDETFVGSATVINNAGNWTINGLTSYDLAIGSKVQATITGSGCESALSTNFTPVQCITPLVSTYSAGSRNYCIGSTGTVALTTSEAGAIYQLVNASGEAQGLPVSGTGSGINLYTNIINAPLLGLYVKAYKIGNNACAVLSKAVINFDTENPSPNITFSNNVLSMAKGTPFVLLPYSEKSSTPSADNYTVDYSLAANNQGFIDISVQTPIPASAISLVVPATVNVGTYSGTITVHSNSSLACTTSYGFTITVYQDNSVPVISAQPVNKTICSGQTTTLSVMASGSGDLTYQWQSSTTYGGTYTNITTGIGYGATTANYTTPALTSTTFFRVIVSNANGNITSNVATVNVTAAVGGTGTIAGTSPVCKGVNGVSYIVSGITNATSYTWEYTGSGALINGTGNSVFINFGATATGGILSVKGNNTCGGGAAATYPITVNPPPTAVAGEDLFTCSNSGAVNITSGASAYNHSSVAWTSSGTAGTIDNANSLTEATYSPSAGDIAVGRVTLTLIATGNAGCGNALSTKQLTIATAPVATFISAPGAHICLNESVTYTTQSLKTDYEWTFSGTSGSDYIITPGWVGSESNTVTIRWLTDKNKIVSVKYKDSSGGCPGTAATISTEVHPIPQIGDFY